MDVSQAVHLHNRRDASLIMYKLKGRIALNEGKQKKYCNWNNYNQFNFNICSCCFKFKNRENITNGKPFTSFTNSIQNGMVYLKNKIAGNDSFFINVEEMKSENENLKKKNIELEQSLRELEILKAENATLKRIC